MGASWSGLPKICDPASTRTDATDDDDDKSDGGKNETLELVNDGVDLLLTNVIPYAAEFKKVVAALWAVKRAFENWKELNVLLQKIQGKIEEGSILRSYLKFVDTDDSNDAKYESSLLDLKREVKKYLREIERVNTLIKKYTLDGPTVASANNIINSVKFSESDNKDIKRIPNRLTDSLAAIHIIRAKIEETPFYKSKLKEIRELRADIAKVLPNINKLFADDIQRHLKNFIPGSRAWLITALDKFLDEPGDNKLFWLNADAGMGKSAFAAMVVNMYSRSNRIVGYFFCRFDDVERSSGRNLIRALAAQIAVSFPECRKAIKDAAEKINDDATLSNHMTRLVEEPLKKFAHEHPSNVLLVIDALDEAYLEGSQERPIMLELLKSMINVLPSFVKVLLTSRPDEDIMKAFTDFKSRVMEIEVEVIRFHLLRSD